MELPVQKLDSRAKLPSYAHDTDAGMDLYCLEAITLSPGQRGQVKTGIAIGIPLGYVGLIWDKSGVSHKRGLKTLGGVIDHGYTGEVFVGIYNTSEEYQTFEVGDKIAQLLVQQFEHTQIVEVDSLAQSQRGSNGIGSTGK
jgi:dUTP pyrophosphatase